MSEALASLIPILDKLSDDERAEVVSYLLREALPPEDDLDDDAFMEELHRRGRSIEDDTARLIPAEELFDELRRKYP